MKQLLLLFSFYTIFSLFYISASPLAGSSLDSLSQSSKAFQRVANHCKDAVISISTISTLQSYTRSPFFNDPFFEHFYGQPFGQQKKEGLGSGVIVSRFGHILTNHHVIERADEITVTLSNGKEYTATLIGSDKKTDLAVLKINGDDDFPKVELGNSDLLNIGEWAIAIGNPFGLAGTVTVGIISATGRSGVMDVENYADFIQTDAAINPGNSGGALLNIKGELIGINTAIFSQSGGYMGIGFAVPVNMAKRVMEDILTYGKVKRGMLGVTIQPVTDDIMNQYDLPSKEGAFILSVQPNSAAEKAGIRAGDLIIELGGKKVTDYLALRTRVSELKANETSTCVVYRNGRQKELTFTLSDTDELTETTIDELGLSVTELTKNNRKTFSISSRISGLVITMVQPGSLGERYRFIPGQVITSINNQRIGSIEQYKQLLKSNDVLLITIYEQGYEFSVVIRK